MKFNRIRWVENESVGRRAQKVLPNLRKYVEGVQKDKIKVVSNRNYKTMLRYLNDPLFESKLAFFCTIDNDIEPFLTMFQSKNPMIPF